MVGDCVLRAISKACDCSWQDAFVGLMTKAFELSDMPSSNYVWGTYLRQKGFVRQNIPNGCPDCYTLREFCDDHPQGKYIVATGTHAVAVDSGNIWDTWDSSDEIVTYYW
jgi:hypothetical protein